MNLLRPAELLTKYPYTAMFWTESTIEECFDAGLLLGRFTDDDKHVLVEEQSYLDLVSYRNSVEEKKLKIIENFNKKYAQTQ